MDVRLSPRLARSEWSAPSCLGFVGRAEHLAGVLGVVVCSLLGACRSEGTSTRAADPAAADAAAPGAAPTEGAPAQPAASAKKTYGEPLTDGASVDLTALVGAPEAHAGKTVLVEGVVRRACSAKGCWLELASAADAAAPGFRVTFKDYGFFIPTDSAGARARVQGTVEVTEVKKSHVEHLEGEGATFDRKHPDGTATEVRVVATGVELEKSS